MSALTAKKLLTVTIRRPEYWFDLADADIEQIRKGHMVIRTDVDELYFHQLRRRAEEDKSLLDKIEVLYFDGGKYKTCGLTFEDELRWPVYFLQSGWDIEIALNTLRASRRAMIAAVEKEATKCP